MNNQELWPALPGELPWHSHAALLLDGVTVSDLYAKLYQWYDNPQFEPLFLDTPLAELSDISPALIRLDSINDPVLNLLSPLADQEWGYLLFSNAPWHDQLDHLRWLLHVDATNNQELLLRLAEPAVAHALALTEASEPPLFGPFTELLIPNTELKQWHRHKRQTTPTKHRHEANYLLSAAQLDALGEASFRQTILKLDEHLADYFPEYRQHLDTREQRQQARKLAEQAYAQGFASEREILLYANVFAYLGEHTLSEHADLAALVLQTSSQSPLQRIERAAQIAQDRAQARKGISA